jgi:COMPASS component SWD3
LFFKGQLIRTFRGHTSYVFCCNFNPQGSVIATGSYDESVRLWDTRTGKEAKIIEAHADPVTSVQFNCDGTLLATGSYDGLCRVWDGLSGVCLKSLLADKTLPQVSCVKFSPNGKYLLVSTLNNKIRLWDYSNSVFKTEFVGHKNDSYCITSSFSTTNGGNFVVSGSEDGNIFIWLVV